MSNSSGRSRPLQFIRTKRAFGSPRSSSNDRSIRRRMVEGIVGGDCPRFPVPSDFSATWIVTRNETESCPLDLSSVSDNRRVARSQRFVFKPEARIASCKPANHRSNFPVSGSPATRRALEAKLKHRKLFDERVNHAAHMIGWDKVVQHHRKQSSLTSSLTWI